MQAGRGWLGTALRWASPTQQRPPCPPLPSAAGSRHAARAVELQHPSRSGDEPCAPVARPVAAIKLRQHKQSVLDISGGGMFFYWKAGVLQYLQQNHDLSAVKLHGSSSGAIIAALAACEVHLGRAADRAAELLVEYGVYDRTFGLAGVWGPMVRQCLEELLPEDCHTRCSGRVQLCITQLPSFTPLFLDQFHSKSDLIDACMASVHLPYFLDGRFAASLRGMSAVDGAFGRRRPSWLPRQLCLPSALSCAGGGGQRGTVGGEGQCQLTDGMERVHMLPGRLHQGGAAGFNLRRFVLDYTFDDRLGSLRFGSVRLRSQEQLQQLVQRGLEYGHRVHRQGVWAAWLGLT